MKNLTILFTLIVSVLTVNAQLPGCATSVNTFPYSEGFESGFGNWNNAAGDQFDWTRDDAGTTSGSTGPSTGSNSSTWYMYIETSSPRVGGDEAWLESYCFDFTSLSSPEISFDYHMYGATMGTLELLISTNGTTWTSLWTLAGDQGNVWNTASVSLAAYAGQTVEFRFRGAYGTSYTGDAAIDNINIVDQVAMTYSSSTVTQTNTSTVEKCASDAEVIGIEVVTSGSLSPLGITQFILRTDGSTLPLSDVTNINVYYTGASSTFATTTLFGSATPLATGNNISVNGTQTLSSGTNYFWVTYDMAAGSSIGNVIDALCNQITVGGSNYTPTVTAPGGNRTIGACSPSPGSVSSDMTIWFKSDAGVYSDAGVTAAVNSGTVQQWNEQSSNASIPNVSHSTAGNQPIYNNNSFNYNPAILFDGVDDFLSSSSVQFSTFTDGSKISMYGVMQHISGAGTNFTWDDAGSSGKITLSPGSSYYDKNGGNPVSTGVGSGNTEQQLVSSIASGTSLNVYNAGAYKNGTTVTSPSGTVASPITFGKLHNHGWPGSVLFGELAIYDASHGATDKNRVESYFAVKYGITLDNSAGTTAGDYTASYSTPIWDADDNASYHNNVIGIGRDDNQSLLQKQSHTTDDVSRVYLNTLQATNAANTGSFASDVSYMLVGDNQGAMRNSTSANAEIPTGLTGCSLAYRLEREWKVTKTNIAEDFSWDMTLSTGANPGSVNVAHLRLLVDTDGNLANGGTTCYYNGDGTGIVITYNNPVVTISGISPTHIANNSTRYVTLASINVLTPLPVELVQFDVDCQNELPELTWETISEINNDYFTIERSIDGVGFNPIGNVEGNGNSSTSINYSWTDDNPINGTVYYRLKQTDFDGKFQYHGIRSITCDQARDISVYPNPFKNNFRLQLSDNFVNQVFTVEVIDYLGRRVHIQTIAANSAEIVLDKQLPIGTYFVKVFNERTQLVDQIIKMK